MKLDISDGSEDLEYPEEILGMRTPGWDMRDYKLWSALGVLPSYGRKDRTDHLVSLAEVEALLRKHAEERYAKKKGR